MSKHVKVDGKVRTDPCFPAGFMDVVSMEASGDQFRAGRRPDATRAPRHSC